MRFFRQTINGKRALRRLRQADTSSDGFAATFPSRGRQKMVLLSPLSSQERGGVWGSAPKKSPLPPELVRGHADFFAEGGIESVDRAVTDGTGDRDYRVIRLPQELFGGVHTEMRAAAEEGLTILVHDIPVDLTGADEKTL